MGSTTIQAPTPRDPSAEMRESLATQIELAPDLYRAESSEQYGQPAYARLGLSTMQTSLMGGGGQPGLLSMYQQNIAPALSSAEQTAMRTQREADIATVEELGPRATAAMEATDPDRKKLTEGVADIAQQRVAAAQAGTLSEPQRRRLQQASRTAYNARGLLYSPAAAQAEQNYVTRYGDQMESEAVQMGMGVAQQRYAQGGDPFMAILGRPSGVTGQAPTYMGAAGGLVGASGPALFQPGDAYSQQAYNQNYQGQLAANTASAANRASLWGAGIGAMGRLGGGFLGRA